MHKMKLLPDVVARLGNVQLQESFIKNGVLNVLANWVRPADDPKIPPGKIAPNKELVKAIISILSQIDTQWLVEDRECLSSSKICKTLLEAVSLEKKESETFNSASSAPPSSQHTRAHARERTDHTHARTPSCARPPLRYAPPHRFDLTLRSLQARCAVGSARPAV